MIFADTEVEGLAVGAIVDGAVAVPVRKADVEFAKPNGALLAEAMELKTESEAEATGLETATVEGEAEAVRLPEATGATLGTKVSAAAEDEETTEVKTEVDVEVELTPTVAT